MYLRTTEYKLCWSTHLNTQYLQIWVAQVQPQSWKHLCSVSLPIVRERNREKHLLCALGSTVPQKFIGVSYIKMSRLIYISYIYEKGHKSVVRHILTKRWSRVLVPPLELAVACLAPHGSAWLRPNGWVWGHVQRAELGARDARERCQGTQGHQGH